MIEAKDLVVGEKYWYYPAGATRLKYLTFMNKVEGRKAYRFAQNGRKQVFIIHESRLNKMFKEYREGVLHVISILNTIVRSYQADLEPVREMYPPRLDQWTVRTGFPRLTGRYGRL